VTFDVAVVGGGLVGTALACGLAERFEVVLVEAKPARAATDEGLDIRVSAITRGAERVLRALSVWALLPVERCQPIREMHVWERSGQGEIHFDSAEIGEPCLGHIVENRVLQDALDRRLAALAHVTVRRPATLLGVRVEPARVVLELDGGPLCARLVVGADGTHSRVRELVGIEAISRSYEQEAVVATVRTSNRHAETAWQRFLPSGPLAFLPLPANHSSIVWSTDPEHAESLLGASDEAFADHLETAFESRLGRVTWVGSRASFALARYHAREYVRERVALVGDAAHTIHPLAGQGVNLGFYDAAALVDVLGRGRARGIDIGRRPLLRAYERWRRGHNASMQEAMEGFHWLFGSRAPGIELCRNVGLGMVDRIAPAKRLIMRHASGLAGDLPPLARLDAAGDEGWAAP
jgi:2-octaprenylphenol hydroxylase